MNNLKNKIELLKLENIFRPNKIFDEDFIENKVSLISKEGFKILKNVFEGNFETEKDNLIKGLILYVEDIYKIEQIQLEKLNKLEKFVKERKQLKLENYKNSHALKAHEKSFEEFRNQIDRKDIFIENSSQISKNLVDEKHKKDLNDDSNISESKIHEKLKQDQNESIQKTVDSNHQSLLQISTANENGDSFQKDITRFSSQKNENSENITITNHNKKIKTSEKVLNVISNDKTGTSLTNFQNSLRIDEEWRMILHKSRKIIKSDLIDVSNRYKNLSSFIRIINNQYNMEALELIYVNIVFLNLNFLMSFSSYFENNEIDRFLHEFRKLKIHMAAKKQLFLYDIPQLKKKVFEKYICK